MEFLLSHCSHYNAQNVEQAEEHIRLSLVVIATNWTSFNDKQLSMQHLAHEAIKQSTQWLYDTAVGVLNSFHSLTRANTFCWNCQSCCTKLLADPETCTKWVIPQCHWVISNWMLKPIERKIPASSKWAHPSWRTYDSNKLLSGNLNNLKAIDSPKTQSM